MVYTKIKLQKLINKLVKEFKKEVSVDKILLFGSYAAGKPHQWSDLDIAVISPDFQGKYKIDRIGKLMDAVYRVPCEIDIEPLGYTSEEYKKASPLTFLGEIKKTGIRIV